MFYFRIIFNLTSYRLMMILNALQNTNTMTIPTKIMAMVWSLLCLELFLLLLVLLDEVMLLYNMVLMVVRVMKGMNAMTRKLARRIYPWT